MKLSAIALLTLPMLAIAAPTTLPSDPAPIAPQTTAGDLEQAIRYIDEVEKMIDGSSQFESVRNQARDIVTSLRARVAVAKGDIAGARKLITQIRGPAAKSEVGVSVCTEISVTRFDVAMQIAPYLVPLPDRPGLLAKICSSAIDGEEDVNRAGRAVAAMPPLATQRSEWATELMVLQAKLGDDAAARETAQRYVIPNAEKVIAGVQSTFGSLTDPARLRADVAVADDEGLKDLRRLFYRYTHAMKARLTVEQLVELADAGKPVGGDRLLWAAFEKSLAAKQTDSASKIATMTEDWASREQEKHRRRSYYYLAAEMWQKLSRPAEAWRCIDQLNGTTPDARPLDKLKWGSETVVQLLLADKRDADVVTLLSQPVDDDNLQRAVEQILIQRELVRMGRHDLLWKSAPTPDPWLSFVRHARVAEAMLRFDAD